MGDPIQTDPFKKELERNFYEFEQKKLLPKKEFLHEATRMGQNLFLKIQKESKQFTVAEVHIAGSIGKRTNVLKSDMDLVVVVNKCPPAKLQLILDIFEDILEKNWKELEVKPETISRKSNHATYFEFVSDSVGRIQVDLLPASNMTYEEIHRQILKKPDNFYMYSSSLVKRQLEFMTSHQSSFVHVVIRLAKYWYKTLNFGEDYVNGGGAIIELIGVAAAEQEERHCRINKYCHCSLLRAFIFVIEMIIDLDTIKLAFKEDKCCKKWIKVSENELNSKSKSLIPHVIGTRKILNKTAFIVEPANPFNDLLGNNKTVVVNKFMDFAKETHYRLRLLFDGEFSSFDSRTKICSVDFNEIFEPQPVRATCCSIM